MTLDVVHRVLQAAFGWMDSHLWRFSLGGDAFSSSSQVFLCPWDVEEGEFEDEGGIAAAAVRLDEAIQIPGETLSYAYDYGDNWELTLRLEHVLPAAAGTPSAVAVDGRRAAPPEDCGGARTADELAEVFEDPSLFALNEVNEALQNPFIVLRDHGLDPRLAALIDRLTYSPVGEDLASRALSLLDERPAPDGRVLHASLTPFIWFLDRAAAGGIPLTASGYLKPADVMAAAEVLPTMHGWIGKANREIDTTPVLHFRKALQALGLLRKHKGSLLLTRAGHDSHAAWQTLWNHLADRLVPNTDGFDTDATLLLLLYAATSPDSELPLDTIAAALTRMQFAYAAEWAADGMPPLSQSLPLDGGFEAAAAAFFGGLLPEGEPRRHLARLLGISESNDYSMLAMIAGDTAGAITLLRQGERPGPVGGDVEWLDDAGVAELLTGLPARPMHVDADGDYRLSLAGAQDKLPVVVDDSGRIGLTRGQTPSTHIIKTPIARLDHTVINEAFCPMLGRQLGADVVDASAQRVAGHEFLLVKRYDRRESDDRIVRLHQEDFCQALGVPTARKYQAEGGPSLADCFALVRRATAVPAREVIKLVDDVALNFLVGNHDAHGKNFSLLYLPESGQAVLAPAYDGLSTCAYRKTHNLTRKMAMSISGEYRPEYVRARHLDRLFDEAGLGAAAARRRLRGMARDAPGAARNARQQLIDTDWDAPILGRIVELIDERARWLLDLTAAKA